MATDYDQFARAYARENETSLLNNFYERPAMVELAGDVNGRRILDVGCGAAPLAETLRAHGALVSGFDLSAAMIDLARERLGDDVDLRVADLGAPLPYADASFDDIVASLVLHYLEDWVPPLRELRRLLRPGGRLICSVNHPFVYAVNYGASGYFNVTEYSEEFEFAGEMGTLTYWHRPLHAMFDAFAEAGFHATVVSEPPFDPNTPRELLAPGFPEDRTRFVCFLFFVLEYH